MELPAFLRFASDATIASLWGVALLLLALGSIVAERQRMRRKNINRVGCMPWTAIFLASALGSMSLITLAVKGWLVG